MHTPRLITKTALFFTKYTTLMINFASAEFHHPSHSCMLPKTRVLYEVGYGTTPYIMIEEAVFHHPSPAFLRSTPLDVLALIRLTFL